MTVLYDEGTLVVPAHGSVAQYEGFHKVVTPPNLSPADLSCVDRGPSAALPLNGVSYRRAALLWQRGAFDAISAPLIPFGEIPPDRGWELACDPVRATMVQGLRASKPDFHDLDEDEWVRHSFPLPDYERKRVRKWIDADHPT